MYRNSRTMDIVGARPQVPITSGDTCRPLVFWTHHSGFGVGERATQVCILSGKAVTYYKRSLRAWLPYIVGTFASRDRTHKVSSGKLAEVQRPIHSREWVNILSTSSNNSIRRKEKGMRSFVWMMSHNLTADLTSPSTMGSSHQNLRPSPSSQTGTDRTDPSANILAVAQVTLLSPFNTPHCTTLYNPRTPRVSDM
jgi:hypothetical protein